MLAHEKTRNFRLMDTDSIRTQATEKLQHKETPDERKVKAEVEEAGDDSRKDKKCNDGHNLKRHALETTKLGGGYRRCSARSS